MKSALILWSVLLCSAPLTAVEEKPKVETQQAEVKQQFHAEPETTLSGLTAAFNAGELVWLSTYVQDATQTSKELETLGKTWRKQRGTWELGIRNPKIDVDGENATATFQTVLFHPFLGIQYVGEEEI